MNPRHGMMGAELDDKTIFHEARTMRSAAEVRAYLDEVCGAGTPQRQRIEDLLASDAQRDGFLETPAFEAIGRDFLERSLLDTADEPIGQAFTEPPGTVIGHYKLVELIGEGGFGAVYHAQQTEPLKRDVALKILKPGLETRQVLRRFEAERQALARLDHPNIAHVHDAGATETGRPYFVMELVTGEPINEYCDQHKLPIPERLNLFIQVCEAVQHAHQKGIIHRDLKPSNILVTELDGKAVPKVIDFGIAKATKGRLTEATLATEMPQLLGTPTYMSPEQAALDGNDVDTRTDVYSLGAVLYELLVGVTPFDAKTLRTAPLDTVLRTIREEEPPRPSARFATTNGDVAKIADNRGLASQRFQRYFRGELDWIVMKAMEKDRDRRFATVNALADDIGRYLAGEAVEAGPPSRRYRVGKFITMHKAGVATAAVLVLGLSVAAVISSVMYVEARQARTAANDATDKLLGGFGGAVYAGRAVSDSISLIRARYGAPWGDYKPGENTQAELQALSLTWIDGLYQHQFKGQWDDAIDVYSRVIEQYPQQALEAWYLRGVCYMVQKDWPAAIDNCTEAYGCFSEDTFWLWRRVIAWIELGDRERARRDLAMLDPPTPDGRLQQTGTGSLTHGFWFTVAALHAMAPEGVGDPERALTIIDLVERMNPQYGAGQRWRGIALCRLGRYEEALKHLRVDAAPSAPPFMPICRFLDYFFLAQTRHALGDKSIAQYHLSEAVEELKLVEPYVYPWIRREFEAYKRNVNGVEISHQERMP